MKWFGEPWPANDRRAPVCENDAERIPVPVGQVCPRCTWTIGSDDRGVAIGHVREDRTTRVLYWHAQCFLAEVIGDQLAFNIVEGWT